MSASVVVVGGGLGGLATALALAGREREVVIVERDPPPPEIVPAQAFDAWKRPGVPQFRHAHLFLARAHTWLRDRHPEVLAALLAAGIERSVVSEGLPERHAAGYVPLPGDEDLVHLWGRRATFEYVLRRHVGSLPNVRFVHGAQVEGLLADASASSVRVRGVRLKRDGGAHETLEAELVVDAAGKRSRAPEWLAAHGVRVQVERHPSNFVYACRHYRLDDARSAPSRRDGGGNLDVLGYATFYAEHGHFALTFGCPVYEEELAAFIGRPEGFDALSRRFPALARWTERSRPTTKVLGAGAFENRWTHYGARGGPRLLGFFAVGDSQLETNPMYGRGVSTAFVQAQLLADVLAESADAGQRARRYARRTRAALRQVFELSVQTDALYHTRARLRTGASVPRGARLLDFLYEHAFLAANERSSLVAREFIKAQQLREVSPLGTRLRMAWEVLRALVASLFERGARRALPGLATRAELLRLAAETPSSLPPAAPARAAARPAAGMRAQSSP